MSRPECWPEKDRIADQLVMLNVWAAGGTFRVDGRIKKDTARDAEKTARRSVARGDSFSVVSVSACAGRAVDVAVVRRDAFGRIWTDLTREGASLL